MRPTSPAALGTALAQKELQEGAVEKERFQAQLEMLVQELEQKQMDLHEANMRAGGPGQKPSPGQLGSPHEVNNLKQQLADAKSKIEGLEKALDEKQKQIVELEGKLKQFEDAGNEEAEKARQELAAREEALMQATQEKEQHTALIKELQEKMEAAALAATSQAGT